MAAYAALVSLMNTVEQIQTDRLYSVSLDNKQIESLGEKVAFLEHFVETHSNDSGPEAEALESQIASTAHAAEDVIEMHILRQIRARSVSLLDLQKVIEDMESVKEMVMKVEEERRLMKDLDPSNSSPAASSTRLDSGKSKMVEPDEELIHLMGILTGQQSSRQIISITGMSGIGKTTLARNAYENSLIVQHFDYRLWATISPEYNMRRILLGLISCIRESTSELDQKSEEELGQLLYKSLCGRRYMLVMDDMWSIEAWGGVNRFFPDTKSGSRIVVTTTESNLATLLSSTYLQKKFLDEGASWSLFCEKAFAKERCPPKLEAIGKKIVKKCGGLPLSIVVIGGHLGKSSRRRKYWENVERDMNSILSSSEEGQYLDILSLSYRYLPAHLKPCFLYMGIFQEDYEIHVTELIEIWVAEGFIKSSKVQSLEEVAEGNFKDLVDRNLIITRTLRRSSKIKTCYIHDLLRDLCLRLAEKEKFLSIMTSLNISRDVRRAVHHEQNLKWNIFDIFNFYSSAPLVRSFIVSFSRAVTHHYSPVLISEHHKILPFLSRFKLLRVLHVFRESGVVSPLYHDFQQYNMRYLSSQYIVPSLLTSLDLILWNVQNLILRACDRTPLSPVSLLWNLQTLIIRADDTHRFPSLIWTMPKLRHLKIIKISLPDPPPWSDSIVLQNLQTLQVVKNFKLSEEVCKRIPNLKILKMSFDKSYADHYCLNNLDRLHKLESLNCGFQGAWRLGDLQNLTLPISLKKLTLNRCKLRFEDLTMFGRLPHLEVFVMKYSYVGSKWNPVEGGFRRLKYLQILSMNLEQWNADSSHFPVLETLNLQSMKKLCEIPLGVGEIPTLGHIHLEECSESAGISAVRILEEHESLGNEHLQVRVKFRNDIWGKLKLKRFRERMENELGSFTSKNLHLKGT